MFDLTGKAALVTGASGGIGGAVAKALHRQGATVAISGTNNAKLDAVAAELGSRVFVMPCDLRDRQAVTKLAEDAEMTRGILRGMMRRRYGRIVNIASISGVLGNPGQPNYAASKAGLVGMTKSLAREVASRGITANAIAPGFIKTPMTDALTEKQVEGIAAAIPAQTFGKPEDVAAGVVFFASSEASYVTGETMHINGGMVMV